MRRLWCAFVGIGGLAGAQELRNVSGPNLQHAAFDPYTQRIVATGTSGYSHEFDGTAWQRRPDIDAPRGFVWFPPGRMEPQVLTPCDPWARFVVHQRDGHRWLPQANSTLAGSRVEIALVHDPVRGHVLAFGGLGSTWPYGSDETWRFDGTDWTQLHPVTAPSPRRGASLACDSRRQRVVLFGGRTLASFDDTWEWDGSTWTPIATANRPSPRHDAAMAYDAGRQRVVLLGGERAAPAPTDHWEYDGQNWIAMPPLPPALARLDLPQGLVYDPARQQMLLVGGVVDEHHIGDVWAFDGTAWNPRPGFAASHRQRTTETLVLDASSTALLAFGGRTGLLPHGELREFRNGVWTTLTNSGPPPRYDHAMWTQPAGTFVFGGTNAAGNRLGDTWQWNGAAWTRLTATPSPSPRSNARVAYDSVHARLVLFGGDDGSVRNDTWLFDGTTWQSAQPPVSPPAHARPGMAFDPLRGRVVLCGDGLTISPNDTWEWDGSTWQQIPTMHAPGLGSFELCFDARLARIVAFSTFSGPGLQMWTYDGIDWQPLTTSAAAATPFPANDWAFTACMGPTGAATTLGWDGVYELVLDPATVIDFGAACEPAAPRLRARTAPQLGSATFAFEVLGADAGGAVLLAGGTQPANAPLLGCKLLVGGTTTAALAIAGPSGIATCSLPIPGNPSLASTSFYWQAIALTGPPGLHLSAGVQTVLGN